MSALLEVDGMSKRFRGLLAVDDVELRPCRRARSVAVIGPNGAGKTTLFNMIAGVFAPDERHDHASPASASMGLPPDAICRRGIGRTFQIVRPFPGLTVEDNVIVGALLHRPDVVGCAPTRARGAVSSSTSTPSATQMRVDADAARPQAARGGARARHRSRSCCCSTR